MNGCGCRQISWMETPRYFFSALMASFALSYTNALHAQVEYRINDEINIDFFGEIIAAGFYEDNSWFGEAENTIGVNGEHWAEASGEFGFNFNGLLSDGVLFGSASGVYAKTWDEDASGITAGQGGDSDDLLTEQAYIGWRSTDSSFQLTAGRQDYTIGSGFLIADGANDGGERGAYWIGARKSFRESAIAKFQYGPVTIEAFSLKNRARQDGVEGEVAGANLEYRSKRMGTFALTYIKLTGAEQAIDYLKGLEVFDIRYDREAPEHGGWFLNAEYAYQKNDNDYDIESTGGFIQVGYDFTQARWAPRVSYRYASLEGDDPDTQQDEGFRALAYGYTDWGTWYQGEITGNFVFGNSNLNSHLGRVQVSPHRDITLNILLYRFEINEEAALGITDDDFGDEINLALDWQVNKQFFVSTVVGVLLPGEGGEQFSGGDKNWTHLMFNASYTF
ncbi:MAG: hypothetical protein JKY66_03435 [Spongiibacteraceae bacterium]|nr:hypothetical protein [Spongiibacteraceae bacterium]